MFFFNFQLFYYQLSESAFCILCLTEVPRNKRRLDYPKRIEFRNLTKADAQVIQCNASNIHGYLWADVFLNVLGKTYMCNYSLFISTGKISDIETVVSRPVKNTSS